jgi:hypothetical protein
MLLVSTDQKERELGREEREEPLRGVHVALDATFDEVVPQVRQLHLQQTIQLGSI